MKSLSVYFECVLVLTLVSCSIKILLESGVLYYILVRIVVRSVILGGLLALVVLTTVRVFLLMCMKCFEKRCLLMIEGYLLVLLEDLGTLLVGTDVGVLDKQFWKFLEKLFIYAEIFLKVFLVEKY